MWRVHLLILILLGAPALYAADSATLQKLAQALVDADKTVKACAAEPTATSKMPQVHTILQEMREVGLDATEPEKRGKLENLRHRLYQAIQDARDKCHTLFAAVDKRNSALYAFQEERQKWTKPLPDELKPTVTAADLVAAEAEKGMAR